MALAVRSMWDPFSALVRQMDTDFDQIARRAFGAAGGRAAYVPAADVLRDGADVVVTLELPGVDVDKDVSVEVAEGRLVISGRRTEESGPRESGTEEGGWLVREMRAGEFRREFTLPEHVTAEAVEADYDRGLLRIRIHDVTKPAVQPRRIAVRQVGGSEPAAVESGTVEGGTEAAEVKADNK